ncbi:hypothetical protein AOLI_G00022880 [Acnodon oligacanthus]
MPHLRLSLSAVEVNFFTNNKPKSDWNTWRESQRERDLKVPLRLICSPRFTRCARSSEAVRYFLNKSAHTDCEGDEGEERCG